MTYLQNVRNQLPSDVASYPRRTESYRNSFESRMLFLHSDSGRLPGHSLDAVLSLLISQILLLSVSQDSSVSIVTRLWNWSSFPSRCRKFSVHCVCTSSCTHPTSSLMVTECCFACGVKLTTQLDLVPRLGMYRTIPPLPHTSYGHSTLFRSGVPCLYLYY
jgi:hypothetical protein